MSIVVKKNWTDLEYVKTPDLNRIEGNIEKAYNKTEANFTEIEKAKLEGIAEGANFSPKPIDNLTTNSPTAPLSAGMGYLLNQRTTGGLKSPLSYSHATNSLSYGVVNPDPNGADWRYSLSLGEKFSGNYEDLKDTAEKRQVVRLLRVIPESAGKGQARIYSDGYCEYSAERTIYGSIPTAYGDKGQVYIGQTEYTFPFKWKTIPEVHVTRALWATGAGIGHTMTGSAKPLENFLIRVMDFHKRASDAVNVLVYATGWVDPALYE